MIVRCHNKRWVVVIRGGACGCLEIGLDGSYLEGAVRPHVRNPHTQHVSDYWGTFTKNVRKLIYRMSLGCPYGRPHMVCLCMGPECLSGHGNFSDSLFPFVVSHHIHFPERRLGAYRPERVEFSYPPTTPLPGAPAGAAPPHRLKPATDAGRSGVILFHFSFSFS